MNGIEIQKKSNKILYIILGLNCLLVIIMMIEDQYTKERITTLAYLYAFFVLPISFLVIIITLIVKLIVFTNKKHKELEKTTRLKK